MKNDRIILAVIILLLLISSGGYYFVTHFPHTQTLVKELIALSAFYAGNLIFLYLVGLEPFVEKDGFLSRIVEVRR